MVTTKSVLIVGASGFIGTHLALRLRENYKVFATYYSHPIIIPGVTTLPFNVDNRNWIKRVIYTAKPDVVIYAVGSNNKEWSDRNVRRSEQLHSVGAATVASTTDITQPRFIYLSNSYVFDGSRGNYHETDTVLPGVMLGKLKLGAENVIKSKSLNYIILRSSPVFGRGNGIGFAFLDQLRMKLDRNQRVEALTHEIHSFAPIDGLCDVIQRLVESGIRNRVLHYGGITKMSYYDFARAFAKKFGYDSNLIVPKGISSIKIGSSDDEAPSDYSLNSTQIIETLKIKPFLLEESFDLIEKQLIPNF